MLKNDTLKNGTSRIGLYAGSAPPPDFSYLEDILIGKKSNDFWAFGKCNDVSSEVSPWHKKIAVRL